MIAINPVTTQSRERFLDMRLSFFVGFTSHHCTRTLGNPAVILGFFRQVVRTLLLLWLWSIGQGVENVYRQRNDGTVFLPGHLNQRLEIA